MKETIFNACISKQSTKLAYYLPYLIENAKPLQLNLPTQSNTQKKTFKFKNIGVFSCAVKGVGTAKIIIGVTKNNKNIEYSITDFNIMKKGIK